MPDPSAAPLPPRKFGYWTGHVVVVASMIGAGILTTSGFTLHATGNPTALLALWVVGGLMALAGAFTIAELSTALPQAGGDYVFVREGFGRGAGFVAGWATFVLGFCGPTAVVAHIAVSYLSAPFAGYLPDGRPWWAVPAGASLLIAGVAAAHSLGQSESGRFQVAITTVKFVLLVGLGVGGLLFGKGDWAHLNAGHWPTAAQWPALATGLIYVNYAYSGWNGAAYLAGELRDPAKLLPRTLLFGTLTVIVLYLVISTESRSTSAPHPGPLVPQSLYRRYVPAVGGSDAYRGRLRRHPPSPPRRPEHPPDRPPTGGRPRHHSQGPEPPGAAPVHPVRPATRPHLRPGAGSGGRHPGGR